MQEVNAMMQEVLSSPIEEYSRKANNRLKITFANWESREHGENKEFFNRYRLACHEVIDRAYSKTNFISKLVDFYNCFRD